MKYEQRHEQLTRIALELSIEKGYREVTRKDIAEVANCSQSYVQMHFPTIEKLHGAIIQQAIKDAKAKVVTQALVLGDVQTSDLDTRAIDGVVQHMNHILG